MRTRILLLATAAALFAPAAQAQAPRTPRQAYVAFGCHQCHGYDGQGGTAPALVPAQDLASFSVWVRTPRNAMPAYPRRLMSDATLADIHRYVASLKSTPALADVPLLRERLAKRAKP